MASVIIDVSMSPLHVHSSPSNSSPVSSSSQSHHTTSTCSPDHQININGADGSVGSSSPLRQRLSKKEVMQSLKESIPHEMKLQILLKSEEGFQKEASCHKKAVRRISKELYTIVSMYALLQGALFAAVAQTSTFTCEDWWGPVGIAGTVTLGTVCGVLEKLRQMGEEKQNVKKSQKRQSAVYDKIELLYSFGSACDFKELEPEHSDRFEPGPVFSLHGILVLGFLVGFSSLIITSCALMLCNSCHCSRT